MSTSANSSLQVSDSTTTALGLDSATDTGSPSTVRKAFLKTQAANQQLQKDYIALLDRYSRAEATIDDLRIRGTSRPTSPSTRTSLKPSEAELLHQAEQALQERSTLKQRNNDLKSEAEMLRSQLEKRESDASAAAAASDSLRKELERVRQQAEQLKKQYTLQPQSQPGAEQPAPTSQQRAASKTTSSAHTAEQQAISTQQRTRSNRVTFNDTAEVQEHPSHAPLNMSTPKARPAPHEVRNHDGNDDEFYFRRKHPFRVSAPAIC